MDINDGGNVLQIKGDRRATVEAKSDFQLATERGDAYIWNGEEYTPQAAGDTILCVRNDNAAKDLYITEVELIQGNTRIEIEIHRITTAFTATGTAVVGANLLAGGAAADATAYTDETGNTQGTVVKRTYALAGKIMTYKFEAPLKLRNGQAIGADMKAGEDYAQCSITGYFK